MRRPRGIIYHIQVRVRIVSDISCSNVLDDINLLRMMYILIADSTYHT